MKYLRLRIFPDWVKKLPPGEYSLNGITLCIKGVSKAAIYTNLKLLNVERIKKKKESDSKPTFYYNWKGANYYYLRECEKKIKKLT